MTTTFAPSAQSLTGIHVFAGLSAAQREAVAGRCRGVRVLAGQSVVSEHDSERDVYFIVSGRVRVHNYSLGGKEVSFNDMSAGEMFGEIAAIDRQPRSAGIVALEDAVLLRMSGDEFRNLLRTHPGVALDTLTHLAAVVRALSERVFEFSTLAVNNRIHAELLRLARDHPDGDNGARIDPAPTHAEMASRISTHREAVTRELNLLQKRGLLERSGKSLRITDLATLQRLVEDVKG